MFLLEQSRQVPNEALQRQPPTMTRKVTMNVGKSFLNTDHLNLLSHFSAGVS